MDVKVDLKNIINEHLIKVASSFFIDKSLAIMDQSAENKESFLAAAERVSKRIALFIDTDLATKVSDILKQEIESRELTPGTRRKQIRVALCHRIYVTHNETPYEFYTGNISEGGVYIKSEAPFPAGTEVEISLPLEAGSHIHLRGAVAHARHHSNGIPEYPAGMGIEFKEVGDDERRILRGFTKRASTQDIIESQRASAQPSLQINRNLS
jgi:type IV pilus assembly protein PilZ